MTAGQGQTAEITTHDRRMFALMNREEGSALHSTATRRRLFVGAHILMTAASVVCWNIVVFGERRDWALVVILALLLPWCFATGVINTATRGLLELRGRVLDERQLAERDRARARAHRLTSGLLLAAALGVGAAGWTGGVPVEGLIAPVLAAVLATHWLMPLWVAGLMVRDEPADEPDGVSAKV
ncbi:hypothetical protein AR457_14160 [Streptomyces agglomeratus]|uniref:Uncharacterized protein n=1 Tax=Streptomyces agglomeratus TaxID=285458 RepID=A0A1E5P7C6_9ACTN|nr:hypothetical protein [Streptomyces agglomeratus]OEJ25430.1 hypothetical protein AS594_13980 [Streptomyces agglomeratus]OEJ40532.1 hypothetical protein BGK70_22490 [Streptomyces agglomeratus]OEJ45087.1 hypothetical protein AR457_14160 [Streptomyces agglomeratus]OEJ53082.1 hypothetical protein BGK72_22125 [Streptomyces agglomeratus]OEJ60418.1 hypothetical protein BGM19_22830 [Streptomyces agglomeratus]